MYINISSLMLIKLKGHLNRNGNSVSLMRHQLSRHFTLVGTCDCGYPVINKASHFGFDGALDKGGTTIL